MSALPQPLTANQPSSTNESKSSSLDGISNVTANNLITARVVHWTHTNLKREINVETSRFF